ncbi:MAG TPA: patatin-like phospholipase family protein [Xanthobacteraceae bacterium]|nr:patatin-like phospholipase family protein [Xanthobacteraceae bacterium]
MTQLPAGPPDGQRTSGAEPSQPSCQRPLIGIALGSGAARGFAHIGVLRTLLARGLRPDIITGTSAGAIIGGFFAAGQLDAITEWSLRLTRRGVLGFLDMSLSGGSLIRGGRLARQLESMVGGAKIETLETRFAAIATEIATGHEVWLTRGRLFEAMRASYALPGLLPPVHVGGRWLVDGALVNPVPVSAARALDARLVIAVNLNVDLYGRGSTIANHGFEDDELVVRDPAARRWLGLVGVEKLLKRQVMGNVRRPGLSRVMVEAYNVMQDRITRARLAGDPADIMISPRLGSVGLFDFHRAKEAIERGAEAAERALETIDQTIAALSGH